MCCFPEAFILEQSGLNIKSGRPTSKGYNIEADFELKQMWNFKNQETNDKRQKTTANDGGRTSPTSCRRHASNKPVFIFNKFNIQRKAILFIKISVFNRNLCISEDQPLHPMYKCSFSLDFALIKHFANYVVSTEVHNLSICSRSNLVTVRAYHQG